MKKKTAFFLLLNTSLVFVACLSACNKWNKAEPIPVYLHIDSFSLSVNNPLKEGSATSKITDVWAYVNGEPVGTYQLPCTFPVLASGASSILLTAGIKGNGLSENRISYEFYQSAKTDTTLTPGVVYSIRPVTHYTPNTVFHFIEDFENGNSFNKLNGDTNITRTSLLSEVLTGTGAGKISAKLGDYSEIVSAQAYPLPTNGTPVYLELDYKNDIPFSIGVCDANYISKFLEVTIAPHVDGWNKMYVQLTEPVGQLKFSAYKLFIQVDATSAAGTILVDNIKLISQ